MEEDGDGEDSTPFWLQSTTNTRRVSSLFFSSGVVVLLLLVTAVFFLVFVLPSTISFSAQIFRPNNVKKSWDSLNIVLVLVALVFGFLSRIKNEDKYDEFQSSPKKQNETHKPKSNPEWYNYNNTIEEQKTSTSYSNSDHWYEHSDYQMKLEHKDSFLRRNSSSYPDLREFSSNQWDYGDYRSRLNDDLHVESDRVLDPVKLHHRRHRSVEEIDSFRAIPKTKSMFVDTLVGRSKEATHFSPVSSPPSQPTAQPPAPPEYEEKQQYERADRRKERISTKWSKDSEPMNPVAELKPPLSPLLEQRPDPPVAELPEFQEMSKREHEYVRRSKVRPSRKLNKDVLPTAPYVTPPPSHSPPPPPQPPPQQQEKSSKSDKKRGGATGSATKDFLNSLYHKKKRRQKSVDNLDSLFHQAQEPISVQIHLPTAAAHPPPPPPTAFQNLFLSKKQKRKRTISVTFPPPPPPPPPPRSTAREPNTNSQTSQLPSHRPPSARKTNFFQKIEENSNSGGESPLNRIPPPPPPPPPEFFKNPAWKFVVQGDYVRVNSSNSSRSGSPDIDDVASDVTPSADEGALTPFHPSPLFCQSPDVNTKAESFITSFRAKLKLEKAHSINGRQLGLSGLGPGSGPSQI